MTHDRTDYRTFPNARLIEEVHYGLPNQIDWKELAIVMAERLENAEKEAKHLAAKMSYCPVCDEDY